MDRIPTAQTQASDKSTRPFVLSHIPVTKATGNMRLVSKRIILSYVIDWVVIVYV